MVCGLKKFALSCKTAQEKVIAPKDTFPTSQILQTDKSGAYALLLYVIRTPTLLLWGSQIVSPNSGFTVFTAWTHMQAAYRR
jgi:hypothetical protein